MVEVAGVRVVGVASGRGLRVVGFESDGFASGGREWESSRVVGCESGRVREW